MDGQYLVRDDHIGIFKNFLSDQLIEDYISRFNYEITPTRSGTEDLFV